MIEVKQMQSKQEIKQFIKLPFRIYKRDPYWVPPLIFEQKHIVFNRKKHPFFEQGVGGEAVFFMVFRDGKPVGRVTAHYNRLHNEYHKVNEGFFGFFEAENDPEAAKALFAEGEAWLRARRAMLIRGPYNYTLYDEIGMLADGWDNEPKTPVLLEMYNPRYYLDLMAEAGYEKEVDWLAFMVHEGIKIKPVFEKIKKRLEDNGYIFRHINTRKLDKEVEGLKEVVNRSWQDNWGHVPYTDKQFEAVKAAFKMIMDPRMILMVEYEGKVVASSISLPDINPSLKKMRGRLFPFGWWYFLRARKRTIGLRTFLFGVLPEHRNKGLDAVLVTDTIKCGRKYGYQWADCSIIVENNTKIIDPVVKWGGQLYRTYRIFKKNL